MAGLMAKNLSDTEIAQMFSDYVTRMEEKERHTGAAVKEADAFDTFLESEFPRNVRLQVNLYDRMMNTAIEFEESGFIAGFKTAMALMSGNDDLFPKPIETGVKTAQEQDLSTKPNKSTHKVETRQHEAANDVQATGKSKPIYAPAINSNFIEEDGVINTKQIADMFETTNFKVVRRIEKQILPYLDETTRKYFIKVEGHNIQHKTTVFYKLNKTACNLYLKEMEPKRKNFVNIAGGCAKLQELMQKVFPSERVPLPA